MRNRGSRKVGFDQVLLGGFDPFADGDRNLTSFSDSITGRSGPIAYNHQGREAQILTALHHLGDAVDGNDKILKWIITFLPV